MRLLLFLTLEQSARLVYDKMTKEPKGFGYVSFPSREDLANALKLDNQVCLARVAIPS